MARGQTKRNLRGQKRADQLRDPSTGHDLHSHHHSDPGAGLPVLVLSLYSQLLHGEAALKAHQVRNGRLKCYDSAGTDFGHSVRIRVTEREKRIQPSDVIRLSIRYYIFFDI